MLETTEEVIEKIIEAVKQLKPYGEIRIQMTATGDAIIILQTTSEKLSISRIEIKQ